MKRVKVEITVIVPDNIPVSTAIEAIENTDTLADYDVDAIDVVWQDDDDADYFARAETEEDERYAAVDAAYDRRTDK